MTAIEEERLREEAQSALEAGNEELAIRLFTVVANKGDWRASTSLGYIFDGKGKLDRTNFVVAAHWYSRALAQEDHPEPHYGLARYYYYGLGGTYDFARAHHHLQRACSEQNPIATLMMAELLLVGLGVAKDRDNARRLFLSVAHAGYAAGYIGLARLELAERNFLRAALAFFRSLKSGIKLIIENKDHPHLWGTGGKRGDFRRDAFRDPTFKESQRNGS